MNGKQFGVDMECTGVRGQVGSGEGGEEITLKR